MAISAVPSGKGWYLLARYLTRMGRREMNKVVPVTTGRKDAPVESPQGACVIVEEEVALAIAAVPFDWMEAGWHYQADFSPRTLQHRAPCR